MNKCKCKWWFKISVFSLTHTYLSLCFRRHWFINWDRMDYSYVHFFTFL